MNSHTRVVSTLLLLGGTPEDLVLDHSDGHTTLVLGPHAAVCLSLASQDTLDKLATLTAQAAAAQRARSLKAVS